MVDRIAPQCPLCNEVVPTASSRDPNESVERHILDGICVGLPGGEERKKAEVRAKKERGEVCWRKGCVKGLIVQMKCEVCLGLAGSGWVWLCEDVGTRLGGRGKLGRDGSRIGERRARAGWR